MTDEEQKIREEIERLKSQLLRGACSSQIAMETRCKEEAYNEVLALLESSQEEPVSIWHDASEETPTSGSNILMVRKEEKDTNYPPIAGYFHGTNSRLDGRNWCYYNGFCYNEIEPPVKWAYIDDILNLSNVERTVKNWKEPVSEDLEEAAEDYAVTDEVLPNGKVMINFQVEKAFKAGAKWQKEKDAILPKVWNRENLDDFSYQTAYDLSNDWAKETPTWHDVEMACKLGANWQKEQFEKNRLAACDRLTKEEAEIEWDFVTGIIEKELRQPTYDDAIKYGMRLQKEQMMAEAIDVEVKVDAGGYPYIQQMELYDYDKDVPLAKEGDKVKVIVIKED